MEKTANGAVKRTMTDQPEEYRTAPMDVPMGRLAHKFLELSALVAGAREAEAAAHAVTAKYEERLRDLFQAKLDEHNVTHTGEIGFDFERSVLVLR